jgi:cytochrome c2
MLLRLISEKPSQILLFSLLTAFIFTACSGHSKKKGGKQSSAVTTPTSNSQSTTNRKAGADTAKTKAISASRGYKVIKSNGCLSCHTTNGTERAAPTFKNLYGRKTTLKDNSTITADSAYLAQSIEDPEAKIVKGYSAIMPKFSYLKKNQIASIIAYIKSISK